jgi:hypothetical protein
MEGNSKLNINFIFNELFDPRDDTTGGDCDMPSS